MKIVSTNLSKIRASFSTFPKLIYAKREQQKYIITLKILWGNNCLKFTIKKVGV